MQISGQDLSTQLKTYFIKTRRSILCSDCTTQSDCSQGALWVLSDCSFLAIWILSFYVRSLFHSVWNIIRYKVHSEDHLLLAHGSRGVERTQKELGKYQKWGSSNCFINSLWQIARFKLGVGWWTDLQIKISTESFSLLFDDQVSWLFWWQPTKGPFCYNRIQYLAQLF